MHTYAFQPFRADDASGGTSGSASAAPASGDPAGGSAGAAAPAAGASSEKEPEPPAWIAPVADPIKQHQAASSFFNSQLKTPELPKEYTPDGMARFHQEQQAINNAAEFRRDWVETLSKPVVFGDGVHVLVTPEQVPALAKFIDDLYTGKQKLTVSDLVYLSRQKEILEMAANAGARKHHEGIKSARSRSQVTPGGGSGAGTPGATVVVPRDPGAPKAGSILDILQKNNPTYASDLLAGKIKF